MEISNVHLIRFEIDEYSVARAKDLDKENKHIQAVFEYWRYSSSEKLLYKAPVV